MFQSLLHEVDAFVYECKRACFCNIFSVRFGLHTSIQFSIHFASKCDSYVISWLPSYRSLHRSMLASTRLCNSHVIDMSITRTHPRRRPEQTLALHDWFTSQRSTYSGDTKVYEGCCRIAHPGSKGNALLSLWLCDCRHQGRVVIPALHQGSAGTVSRASH